jgi:hypothetical protein
VKTGYAWLETFGSTWNFKKALWNAKVRELILPELVDIVSFSSFDAPYPGAEVLDFVGWIHPPFLVSRTLHRRPKFCVFDRHS